MTDKTIKKKTKNAHVPLLIEQHPIDYTGFPVITLVQYRKLPMLVLVDNMDNDSLKVFHLDMCGPEGVDETLIIEVANEWFTNNRTQYPLSVEFSIRGLTNISSKIYRTLNSEFISRVIGPVSHFPMNKVRSVKRRRRKALPPNIEIQYKDNIFNLGNIK